VVQERTFSIVKRFDALFRLTSYYMKQRRALSLLRSELNRVSSTEMCGYGTVLKSEVYLLVDYRATSTPAGRGKYKSARAANQ